MKNAIKPGIYFGLISIILMVLIYLIDPTLIIKWWFGLLMIPVSIAIVCYFGIEYRKSQGGYLPFKDAFIFCLSVFIISGVLSTLFNLLLYTVIDPGLPELITDATVEQTEQMMISFGAPEESIDPALEQVREETPKRFSAIGQLKTFGWSLIGYAVFSLIAGAIVKKKKPEFE